MANKNDNKNGIKGLGIYIGILTAVIILAVSSTKLFQKPPVVEKYSTIVKYFEDLKVKEYYLDLNTGETTIKVSQDDGTTKIIEYKVPNIDLFLMEVQDDIEAYNTANPNNEMVRDYKALTGTPWLVAIMPFLLILTGTGLIGYMLMRQAKSGGAGAMSFAKAKPKMPNEDNKIKFEDVAGADEEKAELQEIVEFLKNPAKFNSLGARIPKGVLLMGPPGTGKTLLAKAVAGEAGVPFFSISGSDFVEMFVGVGASRVRDLFEQAKKNEPSIIFIDEIDAVGRHRGAGLGGGHDEREQTLNQLLVEMDGFGANTGVIVMAATNRRDILDPALLRPGRFDRQIVVGYPDVKGREAILRVHTKNKPLGPDVDLKVIAKTTAGFTGADLENIANEAALLAARTNRKAITMKDIEDATIKVVAGPEKRSHVYTDKDKRLTAFHEAGHAICTYYMTNIDPVHQISIIPRGMAGGYTMSLPTEDKTYQTKKEMQENLVVLLGGRMAEKLTLDDISTGASNDLERVTKIARAMVTKYGFSDRLGPVVYGQDQGEIFLGRDISQTQNYSENVAAEIDVEIREIIDNAYERAQEILTLHMDKLTLVANTLIEKEKLSGEQFKSLVETGVLPANDEIKIDDNTPTEVVKEISVSSDDKEFTKNDDVIAEANEYINDDSQQ